MCKFNLKSILKTKEGKFQCHWRNITGVCDKKKKHNKTGKVCIMQQWCALMQPLLQWKSNKYYIFRVCVCCVRIPACNVHATYFHLRPVRFLNYFPHYLINGTMFLKKLLNIKCVFWFSLQLLPETFLILRRNERDMMKNVHWSSCEVHFILVRF